MGLRRYNSWMAVNAFLQLCISNSTLRTEQHLNNVHWEHCLWMQVSAIITETKTLWQSQPLPISVHWAKGFGRDLTHCLFTTLLNIQLCTSVLKNWKMALENSKNYEIAWHLFQRPVFPCIFLLSADSLYLWQFILWSSVKEITKTHHALNGACGCRDTEQS